MRFRHSLLSLALVTIFVVVPCQGQRAVGDDCSNPLEIILDWGNLPFYLQGETTCGRGNDYDSTCLISYDNGEDFILSFELQWTMSIMITLFPNGTGFTGILVADHCPPDEDCLGSSSSSSTFPREIVLPFLEPGIYYIMVDTWPPPDCNPDFDLKIEEIFIDIPGISCDFPAPVDCSPQYLPVQITGQTTCGYVNSHDNTCLGDYDGGEDMTFELYVPQTAMYTIMLDPHGTSWTGMLIDDACPPSHADCIGVSTNSMSQQHGFLAVELDSGYHYLMVDTWPAPDCIPNFDLTIDDAFSHQVGDDCDLPLLLRFPDDLPLLLDNEYTVGRLNDYTNTCLGDYDESEDFIAELEITSPICLNITLDPLGHAGTGLALSDVCPAGAQCIAFSTNDAATPHGLSGVALTTGTYYLMVDCAAAAGSLPDFSLDFRICPVPPENDDCENALAIANVIDLPFSTADATVDGPQTCQSSPNIWYCYTAQNSGVAVFSLCGSDYDTYLAVYDGCDCGPLAEPLDCSDDYCGLQSELMVEVAIGQHYLIEIGGAGAVGSGVLTAYIPPPECGNVNNDGIANITDAVYLIQYIFNSGPEPLPMSTGDVNCDLIVNITDAVRLIQWIFGGGFAPCDMDGDEIPDCWP